jgi:hypothetical protein
MAVLGLELTDHPLDGGAPSHLSFDLWCDATLLSAGEDLEPVIGRRIEAAVAGVGEDEHNVSPTLQASQIGTFHVRAAVMSVCAKSSPLNSNGSPLTFAKAYAKQSPKFSFAGCPLPLPKSR